MSKQVALEWDAFFAGDVRAKKSWAAPDPLPAAVAGALGTCAAILVKPAMANATTTVMMHAFAPLIQAIQGLSYPVCFIGMAGGMLLISVGQRHRGMNMIKWAAIGYIGMQLVPGLMDMVSKVGDGISSGAVEIK